MFNQYEPNVKATISFIKLLGVKLNSLTINTTLQNHPDWPTLLCISDSLHKWNITNNAGKIDTANIDQLPVPFIAHTGNRESPLSVVTYISDTTVHAYWGNYNKLTINKREDFLTQWNGVYLIAEATNNSGEANYKLNKRKIFLNFFVPLAAFIATIILSFLFLNRTIASEPTFYTFNTVGIYMQYFILLTGVAITTLLLWYEIDRNNPLLQKVCTGIAKGNCNAILSGKNAKVLAG